MPNPRDDLPALDRIEAALEATCAALVTLESIAPGAPDRRGAADGMRRHVGLAIISLRQAIEELRSAQGTSSSAVALGVVLKGNSRARRGTAKSDPSQTKPRRTA